MCYIIGVMRNDNNNVKGDEKMKAIALNKGKGKKESIIFGDKVYIKSCDIGKWSHLLVIEVDSINKEGVRDRVVISKHGDYIAANNALHAYKGEIDKAKKDIKREPGIAIGDLL